MSNADESVTRFAQKHRLRAAAALVQIVDDEDASANARVSASQSILAYRDGRPGQARQVTIADVAGMSRDECVDLVQACCERLERAEPGLFWQIMGQTVERAGVQRPNRFTRGEPERRPVHVPPPRGQGEGGRHSLGPKNVEAGGAPKPPGAPPHRQPPAPPPPTPEPSPLPPAARGTPGGNVSETNTPAVNGHAFNPAKFSNADYDAAGRPLHRIGYGDPSPGQGITTVTPGASNGANGRGKR